jgi:putative tricarboxylic transport membrane protein
VIPAVACRALGVLLAGMGLFAALGAWRSIPLGTVSQPGPGLVPLVLGLALAVLAACTVVAPGAGVPSPIDRGKAVRVGALFVAYALAMPWLGFGVTTALVVFLMARTLSPEPAWKLGLLAVTGAVLTTVLFTRAAGLALPRGPWGF